MRLANFISLIAMASTVLLFSCEEEQDPYLTLNSKCYDLFSDTSSFAYIDECGGCDLFKREYNSMCFMKDATGFFLFDWPGACRKGSEVLMVARGVNPALDIEFFYPDPPRRKFIDYYVTAWVFDDVYRFQPSEFSEEAAPIVDTCLTDQALIGIIEFEKVAFDIPRYHDEMPGEFIWITPEGEIVEKTPVTFHRLELPPYRERWDE